MHYDAATGMISQNVMALTPDQIGEAMRAVVFGHGKGYRDDEPLGHFMPTSGLLLPTYLMEHMGIDKDDSPPRAWRSVDQQANILVAMSFNGDTTLVIEMNTPDGRRRAFINTDAKKDSGWREITPSALHNIYHKVARVVEHARGGIISWDNVYRFILTDEIQGAANEIARKNGIVIDWEPSDNDAQSNATAYLEALLYATYYK